MTRYYDIDLERFVGADEDDLDEEDDLLSPDGFDDWDLDEDDDEDLDDLGFDDAEDDLTED